MKPRTQKEAVNAARQSVALSLNQYRAGTVSYLNVIVAQTAALNNERTAIDLLSRRVGAAVLLIKALGGGWNVSALNIKDGLRAKGIEPKTPWGSPGERGCEAG